MMHLSVIIPTIDSLSSLPALIERLLPQLREDDELIFLDTESIDGTREFLEQLPYHNKRIVTILRGNFSHSATRMQGADLAQGDIVVYLTDDIIPLTDDFLEQLVLPIVQGRVVASTGVAQIDPLTGDPLRAWRYNGWWRTHEKVVLPITKEQWSYLTPQERYDKCRLDDCAACYDREILLKVRFPNVSYGEDIAIAKQLLLSGYKIGYSSDAKFYHWHNISFSYLLRRMCIDQVILAELFGLLLVRNAAKMFFMIVSQITLYTCLGLFIPGVSRRLHWICFSWKYILADNLGKYIASAHVKNNVLNPIMRFRHRLKQDILNSIEHHSIGKQMVAQSAPFRRVPCRIAKRIV